GTADGGFSVAGVPFADYLLRVGSNYVYTSARSIDLGGWFVGRPDAVPGNDAGLRLSLDNLAAWNTAADDVAIWSWGAGMPYLDAIFALNGPAPAAGVTSLVDAHVDFSSQPSGLIQSSRGDEVTLVQLV